eukprot:gene44939-54965_t
MLVKRFPIEAIGKLWRRGKGVRLLSAADGKDQGPTSSTPDKAGASNPAPDYSLDTLLAMAGCHHSDLQTGAVTPPIHFSTTFERDENLALSRGFNYSRLGNPTRKLFEDAMTAIEKGSLSMAFSSGMQAAMSLFCSFPHAHVIMSDDNYHGVVVLLTDVFSKWGVTFEKVDMTNHAAVKDRLDAFHKANATHKRPLLFWMETPTNPKCKVVDIAKLSKLVKTTIGEEDSFTVVDATWST